MILQYIIVSKQATLVIKRETLLITNKKNHKRMLSIKVTFLSTAHATKFSILPNWFTDLPIEELTLKPCDYEECDELVELLEWNDPGFDLRVDDDEL